MRDLIVRGIRARGSTRPSRADQNVNIAVKSELFDGSLPTPCRAQLGSELSPSEDSTTVPMFDTNTISVRTLFRFVDESELQSAEVVRAYGQLGSLQGFSAIKLKMLQLFLQTYVYQYAFIEHVQENAPIYVDVTSHLHKKGAAVPGGRGSGSNIYCKLAASKAASPVKVDMDAEASTRTEGNAGSEHDEETIDDDDDGADFHLPLAGTVTTNKQSTNIYKLCDYHGIDIFVVGDRSATSLVSECPVIGWMIPVSRDATAATMEVGFDTQDIDLPKYLCYNGVDTLKLTVPFLKLPAATINAHRDQAEKLILTRPKLTEEDRKRGRGGGDDAEEFNIAKIMGPAAHLANLAAHIDVEAEPAAKKSKLVDPAAHLLR
ncbi:unnamed protein product [Polarella glacialis]|uniref:Uncharacterized protein n=1 Tax=Polarella glacialis TaxID=89957 RepID=A0A813M2B6_POLGL|nr:unnamed protein product [Polarella glacialis]